MSTRLSVFIATSIDGYIATLDGSLGWLEQAAQPDEDYGFDEFLASVDALAMDAEHTTTSPISTRCRSGSDRCTSSRTVRQLRARTSISSR